ncbi:amino acid ABC transporter [Thioclava sp. SK-1]|uniref:transporter substrate-binding domain-containing protein n=1 Tax=Thioclava sp. SK-1 TaxID=1889770 RepID=UPI00082615E7|nr:transporter substrate-binding domain-containing protein [Thioclava sp. SK-1]OCX62829.1 amino acid ABC transporter [Thioclava sp. SK-1]
MKNLLLASAAIAMTATAAFAQDVVRMGTEGAYPPYNFIDDNGEVAGFERELGDELCARAELTCEWVTNDWDSIIPNLLSGNYDTIIAGMNITAERAETIDFTQNYIPPASSKYMALEADADTTTGVIAAQVNTLQAEYIASTEATLLEFATLDDTVAAVQNGEADAVFADADALKPFVEETGNYVWAGEDIQLGDGVGMGLRKSDTELKEKMNAAILSMKKDGTLNDLIKKYFGDDAAVF